MKSVYWLSNQTDLRRGGQLGGGQSGPFGQIWMALRAPPPGVDSHLVGRLWHRFQQWAGILAVAGPDVGVGQRLQDAAVPWVKAMGGRKTGHRGREVALQPGQDAQAI